MEKWFCKILSGNQGALWSRWKWWIVKWMFTTFLPVDELKKKCTQEKTSQTGNQYVTCLQTLYFLLEIIKNSYENKNRKRGCYWPQAWCWEFFFFSIQEIFSQGISLQVIFSPRNQSAGYMFFEITHIPPPPSKVKWYESWVWSLMFGSAKHALQKGISSLGWKKREFLLVAFNYIDSKRQPFLPFSLVGAGRGGEGRGGTLYNGLCGVSFFGFRQVNE